MSLRERQELLSLFQKIGLEELKRRKVVEDAFNWEIRARPSQLPPPEPWHTWLILAGRGFGKTRTGAETIRALVSQRKVRRIACISASLREAKSVMAEGISGLLSIYPKDQLPLFDKGALKLIWQKEGAEAFLYGGNMPEKLRGPQFDCAWIDEFAKLPKAEEVWEQINLSVRLGTSPKIILTTTPRPIPILKKILEDPSIFVTRGNTFENKNNLSFHFLEEVEKRFANTSLAAQELYAECFFEESGALWKRSFIQYKAPI